MEVNEEVRHYVSDLLPGALFFGSDGSRESLVWDLRQTEPPLYLVDVTNAGWDEAILSTGPHVLDGAVPSRGWLPLGLAPEPADKTEEARRSD